MIYYNEYDRKAAQWLRELMADGLIPRGDVDERSITEVRGADLRGYEQCHFFAGIGGWVLALQGANWPAGREVWTGSCPCQPFSVAGKGRGKEDERHLWPEFARLIAECRPATVFGEQVASQAGREWLSGVFADLEGMDYATAGADLCAASVGAPHMRQRLWWVGGLADCEGDGWTGKQDPSGSGRGAGAAFGGDSGGMGNSRLAGLEGQRGDGDGGGESGRFGAEAVGPVTTTGGAGGPWANCFILPCGDGKFRRISLEPSLFPLAHGISDRVGLLRGAGNAIVPPVATEFVMAFLEAEKIYLP